MLSASSVNVTSLSMSCSFQNLFQQLAGCHVVETSVMLVSH